MKETNNFEKQLTILQEEENKIEKWLKESNVAYECVGAGFEPIEGHQGRSMDFECIGNVEYLDVNALSESIAENVIDDRFYVRVSTYDDEENLFCVEIWLDEQINIDLNESKRMS